MDHLARWLSRSLLTLAIAAVLPDANAWALIVNGGSSVNTTSAGFNSIFYNVGQFDGGSAVYLGDGWALTAQHVNAPFGSYVAINLPNGTPAYSQILNTLTLPNDPDLSLMRLATPPPLPAIYQNIPATQMTTGSVVALAGYGVYAGSPIYWNSATSDGTTLSMGSTSASPTSPINPIPSDTYWTGHVPAGTYQDAGFNWGANREVQWGESVVTFKGENVTIPIGSSTVTSQTFVTTFYNSTYDPPSTPAWATEVSAIGSNMAQLATGDSGGAAFVKSGNNWVLAGTLEAVTPIGSDRSMSNPSNAAFGDLSYAIDLSQYASAIQNVVNTTTTWTGQTAAGATSTAWNTSTSNWVNAANNGTATFTANSGNAQGNAVFGDTNPQYGIRLDTSLAMATSGIAPQTVSVQSAGVAAYSVTFTNTGAANGGTDYLIGNAGSNGISGSTGITLSGNGSGVGGAVYLTAPTYSPGRSASTLGSSSWKMPRRWATRYFH